MKTIGHVLSKKFYVHAVPANAWDTQSHNYEVNNQPEHYATGSVMIAGPFYIDFDVPDGIDLLQPTIDAMRAKQEELKQETMDECNAIEEQIQNMLALPTPDE